MKVTIVVLANICELRLVGICVKAFFLPGISLRANLHLVFMHKVVVTEKKDMYREMDSYSIKTKEQYSVQ